MSNTKQVAHYTFLSRVEKALDQSFDGGERDDVAQLGAIAQLLSVIAECQIRATFGPPPDEERPKRKPLPIVDGPSQGFGF